MNLKKFLNGKIFLGLRIISRLFLLGFGIFLLLDDLLWENIGGIAQITGMAPTIGVIKEYKIKGIHIHHGYIGFIFILMSAVSLYLMLTEH